MRPHHAIRLRAWLAECIKLFDLTWPTFYYAVELLHVFENDGSLELDRDNYQLAGCVSLFLASKYSENCLPTIESFVQLANEAFTTAQFLQMEAAFLRTMSRVSFWHDGNPYIELHESNLASEKHTVILTGLIAMDFSLKSEALLDCVTTMIEQNDYVRLFLCPELTKFVFEHAAVLQSDKTVISRCLGS